MRSTGCVFCQIAAGDEPAYVIREDGLALAVLDINAATRGHTLVLPISHADDIWSIDSEGFAAVARTTHAVADLIRERLAPDGLSLFQANGPVAGQDVFHLHVHLVPRYHGDPLIPPWSASPEEPERLAEVAHQLGGRERSRPDRARA